MNAANLGVKTLTLLLCGTACGILDHGIGVRKKKKLFASVLSKFYLSIEV